MTALVVASEARARVDRIKVGVEAVWQLIIESYQARDWEALGYASWDDMCTREFGTSRLRLPREERAETVQSLRDAGLSLRAIAAATGDSVTTVRREVAGVPNGTPEPTYSLDEVAEEFRVDIDEGADPDYEPSGMDEFVDRGTGEVLDAAPQPVKVTGLDGKQYSPRSASKPRQKPLPDAASDAGWEIRKATERVERIVCDPRYRTNEKQVADALRGHLLFVAETVAAVLDQFPTP